MCFHWLIGLVGRLKEKLGGVGEKENEWREMLLFHFN
jgi:hypothetical protein